MYIPNAPTTWYMSQGSGGLVGHRGHKQSTGTRWGVHKEWARIDYWVPVRRVLGRSQSWYSFDLLLRLPFVGYAMEQDAAVLLV